MADRLEPLPRCEALLKRILDAAEDTIEPRLVGLAGQAIPDGPEGAGFLVLRAGKSIRGPHRLQGTREFYIRRGERAAKMDVREIKDLTLELARTGDRLESAFVERQKSAEIKWHKAKNLFAGGNKGPYLIRVTALPSVPIQVPDLTKRRDLWWNGEEFRLTFNNKKLNSTYPSTEFNGHPRPRLRSFELIPDNNDPQPLYRTLRADGLVEFVLTRAAFKSQDGVFGTDITFDLVAQLTVGVLCQIEHLRSRTGQDNIAYAIEVEICSTEGSRIFLSNDRYTSAFGQNNQPGSIMMPRLEVAEVGDFNSALSVAPVGCF
ncbi:hypothetical protein ACU4GR_33735 (plasmid) [Methylobacterium oryzae CBMB20]